jgi:hypothetical protein
MLVHLILAGGGPSNNAAREAEFHLSAAIRQPSPFSRRIEPEMGGIRVLLSLQGARKTGMTENDPQCVS